MAQKFFIGNTNNLENLRGFITNKANEIDNNIIEIYNILQAIPNSGAWSGEGADIFLNNCKGSKVDLDNLVKFLKDYAELIGTVSNGVDKLSSDISSICRGV